MKRQISVIIPACNEEKNIKKCLESLVGQTYPAEKFEIILVDNNCQDNTVEIAKRYGVGVKIVKEEKQGLIYARIKGIESSLSPIIAFLDADSLVNTGWLSSIEKTFNKNPEIVGIGFEGSLQPKNIVVRIVENTLCLFYAVNPTMPGYCFSFRKEAYFNTGGFDPDIKFGEDVYLSKKLKKIGKIIVKRGMVATSSRRYLSLSSFATYAFKTFISFFLITLFDKSPVELTPFSQKKVGLNLLKNKNFSGNSLPWPEENN